MAYTRTITEPAPRPTRFKELGYEQHARNLWRIIDMDGCRPVGPQYATRMELLADLERYAREHYGLS